MKQLSVVAPLGDGPSRVLPFPARYTEVIKGLRENYRVDSVEKFFSAYD